MKIVDLDGYALNPGDISFAPFEKLGEFTTYERSAPELVVERIGDAEAILTNKVQITDEVMAACPNLRYVGVLATGYNVVDVEAARRRGIVVTNIPSYSTDSVAQFTFGLLLEISHRIGYHSETVRNGRWITAPDFCYWDFPSFELSGKTLGIIGFGHIGRRVARLAAAFDLNVLYYCRHPKTDEDTGTCRYAPLEALFARADIISLHCPLTGENAGLICRENLAKMKDGVILLNTARGGLVKEDDLAEALASGKVAAFGADVVSEEPMKKDNPLRTAPNTFLTPHQAWAPKETRERLMEIAADNLKAFQEGYPQNVV